MTGWGILRAIALASILTTIFASEDAQIKTKRTANDIKGLEISEVAAKDETRNVSSVDLPNYSIKVTMTNYGSTVAKVQQRYLFPDGIDVESFSLKDDGYRAKRSADNQSPTQWVGGMVNLKPSDTKEADMTYINHPAEVMNPNTKTFHKMSTSIFVKDCDTVGGEISSPNYPWAYPNGADLTWLIAYPEGNIVKLELQDYATEECCDHLVIYDGYNISRHPLATFEGYYYPGSDNAVYSTSPAMLIRFTSDCLSTNRGFRASYVNQPKSVSPETMSCGNVQLTSGNSGYVQSPNYPGTYDEDMNCTWPVQTYYGTRVKFVFYNFSTSYDDQVRIYDGTPSNPGNRLASLSGNVYSGYQVTASSNRAFIQFTSGSSSYYYNMFYISYSGENAVQETTASPVMSCGYVHNSGGDSGYILSPNYPGPYDRYMNCTWLVQTYSNTRVKFVIDNFNVGYDDVVAFYEGTPNYPGSLIRTLQGTYYSGYSIYASSYRAFMVFSSGSSTSSSNQFRINYDGDYNVPETTTAASASCGSVSHTSSYTGYIDSPNYPNSYPPNSNCTWGVTTAYGTRVTFNVQNFNLRSGDYLYVYEGTPTYPGSYVKYMSGYYSSGYTVTVDSNQAFLWFVSDGYTYSGYKFRFNFYGTQNDVTTYAPYEETTVGYYSPAQCNSSTNIYTQDIISPGYWDPGHYPNNEHCIWYISTSNYYDAIRFYPHYFSTEYGYDYVRIYNGYSTSSYNLIAVLSGYIDDHTTVAVSNSRYATMTFSSDGIISDRGFQMHMYGTYYSYYTTEAPQATTESYNSTCSANYYGSYSGYVQSPNYPGYYYNNMNCSTWIGTPYGTYIMLTVQYFNLGSGDTVRVYDGFTGQYLRSFSGYYSYGYQWRAYTNYIQLVFTSDSYYNYPGYQFRYDAVFDYYYTTAAPSTGSCGGTFTSNSGTISSPNYSSNYYNNANCIWTITASYDKYVLFTVQSFETESCCDYVSIYGGTPENSTGIVARLRGDISNGNQILVDNNQAYVTFYSDSSVTESGFQITYSTTSTNYAVPQTFSLNGYGIVDDGIKPETSWRRIDGDAAKGPRTFGRDLWGDSKNKPKNLREKAKEKTQE